MSDNPFVGTPALNGSRRYGTTAPAGVVCSAVKAG